MRSRRTTWTAYAIAAGSVFAMSAASAWAQDATAHATGLSNDWIRSAEDRAQDPTKFPPRVNRSESAPDSTGLEHARTQADEHAAAGLERAETNAADPESSSTARTAFF